MCEETREEFFDAAVKEFGNKICVNFITISDENLDLLNEYRKESHDKISPVPYEPLTQQDLIAYEKQVWSIGNKCPKCNSDLGGILGSFVWGFVHGQGRCSDCGTQFQLYHYVKKGTEPLMLFSLIGF